MADWIDVDSLLDALVELISEFDRIVQGSPSQELLERLGRWKERTVRFLRTRINEEEAKKYEKIRLRFDPLIPASFNGMLERHSSALVVLREEIAQHPDSFFTSDTYLAVHSEIGRVFVSHAAADRPIAEFLRDELIKRRPGTEVFLASRPGHIGTGEEWWQTIQRELRSADAYVVLLTPTSIVRPWIPFETGAAWMTGRPVLTVFAGELSKSEIPNPLAFFQVNSLEQKEEAEAFLVDIGAATEDLQRFCDSFRRLSGAVAEEQERLSGWVGVQVGDRFLAWEGPLLHTVPDWPSIPTPSGLIEGIRQAGWTPSYGVSEKLEEHLAAGRQQVFETDRKSFRRQVVGGGKGESQILLVRRADSERGT